MDKDIHTSSLLVYAYRHNMVGSAVFGYERVYCMVLKIDVRFWLTPVLYLATICLSIVELAH